MTDAEREQLLAQATQERARLEAVLQQMPGGVVIVEATSGRVLMINAEAERLARPPLNPPPVASEIPLDALTERGDGLVHPDSWPLARALRNGEVTSNQEMRYLRDDGSLGTVLASAGPIRDRGIVVAAVATFNDITAQRSTEERLHDTEAKLLALFHANVIGIAWGEDDIVSEANDELLRILGCTRDDLPLDWNEMTPPEQRWMSDIAVQEAIQTGRFEPYQREFLRRNGLRVPVVVGGRMLASDPFRYVVFVLDITTQKEAEREHVRIAEELRVANLVADSARRDADRANAAKSDFLSSVSHEIRTPLNAIIGYVQLLEMGVGGSGTEAQRSYLSRLRMSSDHLMRLVSEVLDIAKAESGSLTLAQRAAQSHAVIDAAIGLIAPLASSRGIAVVHSVRAGADDRYIGDEDRVRQILVNLLGNAVKFTPMNGIITIECGSANTLYELQPREDTVVTAAGQRSRWATITVTDTGIGIAVNQWDAVFEPFVQVEGAHDASGTAQLLTHTERGTGLGLAISRRLARAMGGDLTVRSRENEGSVFTLWLPAPIGVPVRGSSEGSQQP